MEQADKRIWELKHQLAMLAAYHKTTLSQEIRELLMRDMQTKAFELQTLTQQTQSEPKA